jgi:hypothetical protein
MVWARVVMAAAERVGMVLGGTGEAAGKVVAARVGRGENTAVSETRRERSSGGLLRMGRGGWRLLENIF